MFTRSRIVRPRALLTLAATALALAATATSASAADFTWQASVSTTQAAARPNLTLTYNSSSSAALTGMQIELASGSMPRRTLAGACSPQLFRADQCPSTSVVGTVASTIVIARIPLPTNGTIYQLSESGDAANTFGIVLRPPLSSLGLTGKIFLSDQISFTNGGGIRHTIGGPLNTASVLGIQMPSRISMLRLQYNGSRGVNPLYESSTNCGENPMHARASFSDGTTADRTASFVTTGCPAVPFAPTAEVQLDNDVAGQRTTFSVLLSNSSSGSLAAGHVSKLTVDLSDVGPADTSILEALPNGTEIATITADVDSYGLRTGSIVRDSSAPSGFTGTLKLGPIVHVMIGVSIASGKLTLSNLPQLPLKTIRIGGKPNAAWITNTCAVRTAHVVADSFSGGHVVRGTTIPKPRCDTSPPVLTLLDPADMDSDGDGYADVTFRNYPTLEVLFGAEDESGIDPSSLQCSIAPRGGPGSSQTGKTGMASGKYSCSFTDVPPGDSVVSIQAADPYGHVTVLKMAVIIDGSPPSIAIDEPGVHLASSPDVSVPITVSDDSLFFPQGEVTAECARKGWDGTVKGSAKIVTDRDSGRSKGFCTFSDVPDGKYKVEVRGWDPVKKEAIAEGDLDVDSTAPVAQFVDFPTTPVPNDFDLFFTTVDEGSGVDVDASTCSVTPRKGGVVKGNVNIMNGSLLRCSFTGVPDGPADVEISVVDHRGHVTVLKAAVTVDGGGPTVTDVVVGVNGWATCAPGETVPVSFLAVDGGGIVSAAVSFPGQAPQEIPLGSGDQQKGNVTLDCRSMTTGQDVEYRLSVTDTLGNTTAVTGSVKAEKLAPTVAITTPAVDGTVMHDTQPTFVLRVTDDNRVSTVYSVEDIHDSSVVLSTADITYPLSAYSFDVRHPLPDGEYRMRIVHRDIAARRVEATRTFTVEADIPPIITINVPSEGQSVILDGTMNIGFGVEGTGPFTVTCLIDNIVVLTSCRSGQTINTTGMSIGTHVLSIVAEDPFGRRTTATRSFRFIADTGGTACVAVYPPPPGCPGYIPPGGGVITFP